MARDRIGRLDAEIEQIRGRHPDAALIGGMPGTWVLLAAACIAEAGAIRRFPRPEQWVAAAGLAPAPRRSGTVDHMIRGRGGDTAPKRALYRSAFCSPAAPESTAVHARKRRERERQHQALIGLARRRVDVQRAIASTGTPDREDLRRAA